MINRVHGTYRSAYYNERAHTCSLPKHRRLRVRRNGFFFFVLYGRLSNDTFYLFSWDVPRNGFVTTRNVGRTIRACGWVGGCANDTRYYNRTITDPGGAFAGPSGTSWSVFANRRRRNVAAVGSKVRPMNYTTRE